MLTHMFYKSLLLAMISFASLTGCGGGGGGGVDAGSGSGSGGAGGFTVTRFVTDADLNGSRHIAFSGTDLYVAVDVPASASDKVLKFDSSGVKTTLVPSGSFSGITSPFGIAASGSDVYVSGTKVGPNLKNVYLVANASSAERGGCNGGDCYGVALGEVNIANSIGVALSYVDQTPRNNVGAPTDYPIYTHRGGAIVRTTFVQSMPTGLVFYNRNLYVTRHQASTNGAIQKIELDTNTVSNFAGSSLFNGPNAIAVDQATGNFYVVNDGDGKVLKISGGNVTVHLDSTNGLSSPGGVAVGNGFLYVSNNGFILKASL